jgi:hypothetical protein
VFEFSIASVSDKAATRYANKVGLDLDILIVCQLLGRI